MKKLIIIISILMIIPINAKALNYNEVRYSQDDNTTGTNIWWIKVPAKYKMYYSYGKDKVRGSEKPSENAKRHKATIAVNTQYMGIPEYNGIAFSVGDDVSEYDFYNVPNSLDLGDTPTIKAVKKGAPHEGINLSYVLEPKWCQGACFMTLISNKERIYEDEERRKAEGYSNIGLTRAPRSWLTIDSSGNQYIAVSAGRNEPLNDGSNLPQAGLTLQEIIDTTKKYMTKDIEHLYNLDGGGSSSFVFEGNKINPHYDDNYTTERTVRGIFYWLIPKHTITAHYVLKDTNEKLAEDEKNEYYEGDSYETNKKTLTEYRLESIIGNEKGTVTKDTEITYIYEKLSKEKNENTETEKRNTQIVNVPSTGINTPLYITLLGIALITFSYFMKKLLT